MEPGQIGIQTRGAVRRAGVAPAIPADRPAIGDMQIERHIGIRIDGIERGGHVVMTHPVAKFGGGGIAGVARHGPGEQVWMIGPHGASCAQMQPTCL
ncbi:hypothetical protein GCM10020258_15400 [Sphingomonas yabuuchiae]